LGHRGGTLDGLAIDFRLPPVEYLDLAFSLSELCEHSLTDAGLDHVLVRAN
jgi:hypothetical protein